MLQLTIVEMKEALLNSRVSWVASGGRMTPDSPSAANDTETNKRIKEKN
jgi:hypothetical protein